MEGEIKDPKRENERSNWASKRLGLGPEIRNSNSGLHLKSLYSVKLRTQPCPESSLDAAEENVPYALYKTAYATLAVSSILAPLHESFASNAFLSLSQALFNP
ncbi:hypothetical protein PIB30_089472 [Stylosanthes scabra]|uniref:Uncharacterized protein n=1 Tax=Stylosanthes scabra TaxID=79078 RepID=A0ABU6SUC5_9FABA|nr:hypothetical protein [Stylosanthes scabra]